jgi:hypothetical protein
MKRLRMLAAGSAALGLAAAGLVTGSTGASADATVVLAQWNMDEAAGATTMADSGPGAMNGAIGSAVQTGVVVNGATAYRWSSVQPNQPPAKPERLVVVDNAALNPGTRDYAVTFRYRSTYKFGNIIQKGQAHVSGGYFKVEQPGGHLNCFFTGRGGKASFKSPYTTNDGQWHVVRCERTATQVALYVDGVLIGATVHATGNISNTTPLTIGGKLNCDNITITCDYFAGDIDNVTIQTS